MKDGILSLSELSTGVWKYVITHQGTIRFASSLGSIAHIHMVPPGEEAKHAGYIVYLNQQEWSLAQANSQSLGIWGDAFVDAKILSEILGSEPIEIRENP